ncbi:MAG: DUF1566 domain-containing protein [Burkholderiales bacterium]|nr:DUF1566 domain-containing protein [Burkholderiales bacterium]
MTTMNRKTVALAAVFGAVLTAGPATAFAQLSTAANGPYYATPSWDQKLTTNRFVILANWNSEAVLDRETGLVWEKKPKDSLADLSFSALSCHLTSTGGRRGWRLPRAEELSSLLQPDASGMATLPDGHPFEEVRTYSGASYWSATRSLASTSAMWVVSFRNGAGGPSSAASHHFWCVRGGQGADAQ